jgi:hypothetical protein
MAKDASQIWPDDGQTPRGLPAPKTVYLPSGEQVYEFQESDFGVQPEWQKDDLIGQLVIVRGLSEDTWQQPGSSFPPARAILYNVEDDDTDTPAWGMFATDDSAIINQVRRAIRKGAVPFVVTLAKRSSEAHKGQEYYIFERYVKNITEDADTTAPTTSDKKGK